MSRAAQLKIAAWGLSAGVAALAIVAWGQSYRWQLGHLSMYQIFPLLGLLAFSLMWSHYIASIVRQYLGLERAVLKQYFEVTSFVVLTAICLHPGLLIYQLWRDGAGLPPGSYERYVAPGLGWVTLLGTASLLVFLAYELRRKFGERPWWKFVAYASDAAMLAIFYHGLRLGGALQRGWFHAVWFGYGITLVAALIYIYRQKFLAARTTN